MRILFFGDSITQGFWDTEGGWVARIRKIYDDRTVAESNYDHPSVFNLGVSADSTVELLNRFEPEIKARVSDELTLVVSIGVNDSRVKGEIDFMTLEEYRDNLQELMSIAKNYTDKIMFVGLTPAVETRTTPVSWNDTSYFTERLLAFDAELKNVCAEEHVQYVELFGPLQKAQESAEHFTDGLHPDSNGHQIIADIVFSELEGLFDK